MYLKFNDRYLSQTEIEIIKDTICFMLFRRSDYSFFETRLQGAFSQHDEPFIIPIIDELWADGFVIRKRVIQKTIQGDKDDNLITAKMAAYWRGFLVNKERESGQRIVR